jgi:carboxymethylenebutenolidase
MSPEIKDLYTAYARGVMDRREFLTKLAAIAGGTAAAAAILPGLEAGTAAGPAPQLVPADDPRLETGYVKYPIEGGEMKAYSAKPKGAGKLAGVIVIHENRGLNPHTEDVARRVALEGFHAIAPDALSPLGGTPANPDEARPLFQKLDRAANTKNFVAAVAYLKTGPQATGKVACMGFCWGGAVTNQVAVNAPDLTAAIPFYGSQPAAEDVPKIKAAMLIHYAGDDERINAGIPAFEEALKNAGVVYTIHTYPGAGHAFMNDTGQRYNKEAAELAWQRTVAFLKDKLKS